MRVLVTGGAGYIGSHAVRALRARGDDVVVLDNLARGHRDAVPPDVPLVVGDLRDFGAVSTALDRAAPDAVLHFAALAYVGESVDEPLLYYDNNVAGSATLLRAMQSRGVRRLVFSSTCATYGEPERTPIDEGHPQRPVNPYGWSKLFVERILADVGRSAPEFAFAALRYFNVAGSARDGSLGERHDPETHLIPVALQVALGERPGLVVHGADFPTSDGTCVRDYVYVEDLVDAHLRVLDALRPGDARHYNVGLGRGFTVLEVVRAVERVTGRSLPVTMGPRRPGDPAVLFADATRLQRELGWAAATRELDEMVETAWRWFREHGGR